MTGIWFGEGGELGGGNERIVCGDVRYISTNTSLATYPIMGILVLILSSRGLMKKFLPKTV